MGEPERYTVKRTWFVGYRHYEGQTGEVVEVVPSAFNRASDAIRLRMPDGTTPIFDRAALEPAAGTTQGQGEGGE